MAGHNRSIGAAPITNVFEAIVLGGNPTRRDPDGLAHFDFHSVGLSRDPEEARHAADHAQPVPDAVGSGTREQHVRPDGPGPLQAEASRRFVIYRAPSDCMAPTINSGDYVEIDTSVRALAPYKHLSNFCDGLFLLDFPGGDPMIRRLASRFNGRYQVFCDRDVGRLSEADEVAEADLTILGRVTRIMNIRKA